MTLNKWKRLNALDVASGPGIMSQSLSEIGISLVTGIDTSSNAINIANKINYRNFILLNKSIGDI